MTAWEKACVGHGLGVGGTPSFAIASQSGFTAGRVPLVVGELRGGVTGALEEFPYCITCNGGRPALLLVLVVPLPPPPPPAPAAAEDKPLSHGMSDVPSPAPGYEDAGLTDGDGETSIW